MGLAGREWRHGKSAVDVVRKTAEIQKPLFGGLGDNRFEPVLIVVLELGDEGVQKVSIATTEHCKRKHIENPG